MVICDLAFEYASIGMALLTAEGQVIQMNPALCALCGYTMDQFESRPFFSLLTPEAQTENLLQFTQICVEKVTPYQLQSRIIKANGCDLDVNIRVCPYKGSSQVDLYLLQIEDISDRVRAEVKKKHFEHSISQRLSLAVSGAGFGIWESALGSDRIIWDAKMYEIYGMNPEDFDGSVRAWRKLLHPDDLNLVDERFLALTQGKVIELFEFRFLRPSDGELRYIEGNGILELDPEGRPHRLVGMNRDVTERRRAESALLKAKRDAEDANQAKTVFLANMSHEIRTPLAIIVGYSELLGKNIPFNPQTSRWIGTIKRTSLQLELLVNDILDISKVEAGRIDVDRRDLSLRQLIFEVEALMQLKAAEKGILLQFKTEGVLPRTIESDAPRLKQILINIIGNAIKFTQQGGVIVTLKLVPGDQDELCLAFVVEDSGLGIGPEAATKLFVPFTQADGSITRKYGGTGLGLSLSRRLAQLLGGNVVLTRSSPARGSVFTVTIHPGALKASDLVENLETYQMPPAHMVFDRAFSPGLSGFRILVVDDAPDLLALVSFILETEGALVSRAKNGVEALNFATDGSFDLILMDLQMPVLDGYAAMSMLRSRGCQVPIFALTAHAMEKDKESCLEAGFQAYLTKPLNTEKLLLTILEFIGKPLAQKKGSPPSSDRAQTLGA